MFILPENWYVTLTLCVCQPKKSFWSGRYPNLSERASSNLQFTCSVKFTNLSFPLLSIMSATMVLKVFALVMVLYNVYAENVWPEKLWIMACQDCYLINEEFMLNKFLADILNCTINFSSVYFTMCNLLISIFINRNNGQMG